MSAAHGVRPGGAMDGDARLVRSVDRNVHRITHVFPTADLDQAASVFRALFPVDHEGSHPRPMGLDSVGVVRGDRRRGNRPLAPSLGLAPDRAGGHLVQSVESRVAFGTYDVTIWTDDAIARSGLVSIQVKAGRPLGERCSVVAP